METSPGDWGTPYITNDELCGIQNSANGQDAFAVGSAGNRYNPFNGFEESNTGTNAVDGGDAFGSKFIRRTRKPQNQPLSQNFASQGTAHRRIRIVTKMQAGPVRCLNLQDLSHSDKNHESESTVTEVMS